MPGDAYLSPEWPLMLAAAAVIIVVFWVAARALAGRLPAGVVRRTPIPDRFCCETPAERPLTRPAAHDDAARPLSLTADSTVCAHQPTNRSPDSSKHA